MEVRKCIKRAYATVRDAQDNRKLIKKNQGKRVLRVYKCPYCPYYHLTHQKQR